MGNTLWVKDNADLYFSKAHSSEFGIKNQINEYINRCIDNSNYYNFYVVKVNVRDLPVGTLGEESFDFEVAELNGDWDVEWNGVPDSSFRSHAVLTPIDKWFKFACTPEAIKVSMSPLFHFALLKMIN